LGDSSDNALAALENAAHNLNMASAFFALAVFLSLGLQLLFTSPDFRDALLGIPIPRRKWTAGRLKRVHKILYYLTLACAWTDLAFVVIACAFTAQAMKEISPAPGRLIEYGILTVGIPIFAIWIICLVL